MEEESDLKITENLLKSLKSGKVYKDHVNYHKKYICI